MHDWSFDIDRQGSLDAWCWVCLAGALVLATHVLLGWKQQRRVTPMGWIVGIVPMLGTILLLLLPPLRPPLVGMIWTMTMLVAVSITQYAELKSSLNRRQMYLLMALRLAAIVLAVPMLFEPVLRFVTRKTPDRPLVILVDRSSSMSVPDAQNGPTRLQSVGQAIAAQWPHMNERFAPVVYGFSTSTSRIEQPTQLANLPADGSATDIVSAVSKVLWETKRDDAQFILVSDGIDNTSADVLGALRASRRPIHTVLVGSDAVQSGSILNLSVDSVDPGDEWTVNDEATIKVNVKSAGLSGRVVDVNLAEIDDAGKPIGTPLQQRLVLEPEPGGQEVKFGFRPRKTGVHKMATWVDPIAGERSTADNRREFQQLASDARIKVLYIEGRARPEYRELSRALSRDANIEAATLLRVTSDRFSAGGAIAGKTIEKVPFTLEQWKVADVIILGDLDASFLNAQQQQALERAVSEGAGLLMLGGQNSFGPGNYQNTPVEKILPVMVGPSTSAQEKTEFVPRLTQPGQNHPAMQGLAEWFGVEDKAGAKPLPTLLGNVVVASAKPDADVLLTHRDRTAPDGQPQVILATHRYGKGRSAAFTTDTTYRWYLPMRGMGQESPYTIFWGQLVRWLADTDVKNRGTHQGVEALIDKSLYTMGESARLRAVVRDQKGDATRFAQVTAILTHRNDPSAKPQTLALTPSTKTGMYEATIANLPRGEYDVQVRASKDKDALGESKLGFAVIQPADEMLKLAADAKLMQSIAAETGGYAYTLSQWPDLIDTLVRKQSDDPLVTQRSVPLHNTMRSILAVAGIYPAWPARMDLPIQGTSLVILFAIEWILRRKWQLL